MKALDIKNQLTTNFNDISKCAASPKAFSLYAMAGVALTTIVTIVCVKKKCQIEYEKKSQEENSEKEFTREEAIEEIKQDIKLAAPIVGSALLTIFLIRKSGLKWMEYNGVINTAYLAAISKANQYRGFMGGLTLAQTLNGVALTKPSEDKKWFCIRGLGNQNDIYFEATDYDVMWAMYHLNRNFQYRGSASVREFFAFLQILDQYNEVDADYFGWDVGTMIEDWGLDFPWIDFGSRVYQDPETNVEITEITYMWDPEYSKDGEQFAHPIEYDPYGWHPTE